MKLRSPPPPLPGTTERPAEKPKGDLPFLAPPPRRIPASMAVGLLFGGHWGVASWTILIFFLMVLYVLIPKFDLSAIQFDSGAVTTPGLVVDTSPSGKREGRRPHRIPIWEYSYTYETSDGTTRKGVSYQAGMEPGGHKKVSVEYLPDHPERSRIVGMRTRPFRLGIMLLCMPFMGVMFVVIRLAMGLGHMRALSRGVLGVGRLWESKVIETKNSHYHRLTFAFVTQDGQKGLVDWDTTDPGPLEDDARELLFYDPKRIGTAAMFDGLPGRPKIGPDGQFYMPEPMSGWISLLPPLGALAVLVLVILQVLGQ